MKPPETRYAKSGDVHIAFQVAGEGPLDLVFVPGWVSHVEHAWQDPSMVRFLERLASFSRLILLDRRGTGLSDPVADQPTLEERMDDVRAVMDAAGSPRAALLGISEGGPMCALFAATHPTRTTALILCNTIARGSWDADYTWQPTRETLEGFAERAAREWGSGITASIFAPSRAGDAEFVRAWGRYERLAVSPGGIRKLLSILIETDVRHVLPSIRVPTLIVHRKDDQATRVEGARYMAERIPGARYVELPGGDHFVWVGDTEAIVGEIQEFLTGGRSGPEPDRVLATLSFTDIAGSTEHLTRLGDRGWRDLLQRYYAAMRGELVRFRGREVDCAGDSLFARFDGPARAIRFACAARDAVRAFGLEVRTGVHTGECTVIGDKVSGIAVHLAARVAAVAQPNEVLVSSTVVDLVAGSGLRFDERGRHTLKGIPGEWRLFGVEDATGG